MFDVIIIGGSYAGISAAIQLGRARQRTLVVDGGQRRNRFASHSHGALGHDGRGAAELAELGRAELRAYATVTWQDGMVVEARGEADGFQVVLASGATHVGRRLVLAGGVVDELPALPGVAERWGTHIFHCPYCHGYELDRGRVGVIATSPLASHVARLLTDWGPTTLFLQGHEPDADALVALDRRGVTLERAEVTAVEGAADVRLADGRLLSFAGLFLPGRTRLASPLVGQLGCAIEDGPMGPYIHTDPMRQTSVPGVYAAGDAAMAAGSVAFAVADGARAGISAHQSLVFA